MKLQIKFLLLLTIQVDSLILHTKSKGPYTLSSNKKDYESTYSETSSTVKGIVNSLTNAFVSISKNRNESPSTDEPLRAKSLSPNQLLNGVKEDFSKKYLWNGQINENLYSQDCLFTDPTLSFKGLETYRRNVGSLQPLVRALVPEYEVELLSCEMNQKDKCIKARWRMYGDINVFWNPRIDVVGRTKFSYDPSKGNRIVNYFETWEMPASKALFQLITPRKKKIVS
mmetsp:Transcript_9116/g.13666  ORF Transcript_9116/g.13666 Transcript_9116/m.13666 type:complete len:227 (+) Transcript_9116:91-771(+)